MKKYVIALILLVIIAFASLSFTVDFKSQVIAGINQAREGRSQQTLTYDYNLQAFANTRVSAVTDNFSHAGFFETKPANLSGYYLGEIIARSYNEYSGYEYVNAWLKSPVHSRVIYNPWYSRVAVATYSVNGINYVVVILGIIKN